MEPTKKIENKPPYLSLLVVLLFLLGVIVLTASRGALANVIFSIGMFSLGCLLVWSVVNVFVYLGKR